MVPAIEFNLVQRGTVLVILLRGGDKSSQRQAIRQAKELAKEV